MQASRWTIENLLKVLLRVFLFVLPWRTIWVYKEQFLNDVKWEYGTLGFFGSELLLWLCVLLFMVWYIKKLKVRSEKLEVKTSKDRVFLFFCLLSTFYFLLSTLWALDKEVALQHSLHIMEAFLLFVTLFVGPLSFRQITTWFVAGSILPSILGVWQFLAQSTFASTLLGLAYHPGFESGTSIVSGEIGRWLRAYGSFSHPNVFGGYLVIAISMLLLLTTKLEVKSMKYKVFFLTVYSLQFTALFFTFSRSAWLAFTCLLVYLFISLLKNKLPITNYLSTSAGKQLLITILLLTLLSIIFFPLIKTRFSHSSVNEIRSTTERISGYSESLQIFKQNPWLGVGAGNYTLATHQLDPDRPGWEYQPVHNVFALFIVEFGIIGAILILLLILSLISYLLSQKKNKENEINTNILSYLFIIPYLLLLLFDHYLFSSYIGLVLTVVYFAAVLSPFHPLSVPSKQKFG